MRRAVDPSKQLTLKGAPATTREAREAQLIALAEARAEQQLRDGTASSQVICHYLNLNTEKTKLERDKLKRENVLLKAKTEALASEKRVEELYSNAIKAFKGYQYRDPAMEDYDD